MGEYCGAYLQMIRGGRSSPVPCQRCGIGTLSETRICKGCGQQAANSPLLYIEARARRHYSLVIEEMEAGIFHLKRCRTADISTEGCD